jgi:predicted AAA+ superfamily ATPase
MEILFEKSNKVISAVNTRFKRYLYDEIDWNDRLIIIRGGRGVGKTTMILQHIKDELKETENILYISMDDLYFLENTLSGLARQFAQTGGKHLFIDEVHKYKNWSAELKNIYDFYPEIKVVVTGSSALEILKSKADLSRRASVYHLNEMSLREYISLIHKIELPKLQLEKILTSHHEYAKSINQQIKPIKYYNEFIRRGAYPFINDEGAKFGDKLISIITAVIENDLPAVENITYESIIKLKKLLYFIATSAPFKPNISELSQKIATSRDQLLRYLDLLERSSMIKMLRYQGIATSMLTKPEKIYLNNTMLMHVLDERVNAGAERETFFFQQLRLKHKVNYTKQGDFLVDGKYIFEIGGTGKTGKQIAGLEKAFIAADGIEYGLKNKIPLWMFGFLY